MKKILLTVIIVLSLVSTAEARDSALMKQYKEQLATLQDDLDAVRYAVRDQAYSPSRLGRDTEVQAWNRYVQNFGVMKKKFRSEDLKGFSSEYFGQVQRLKNMEDIGLELRAQIVKQEEGDEGLIDGASASN